MKSTNVTTLAAILERLKSQILNTVFHGQSERLENIKKNFESIKAASSVPEDEGQSPVQNSIYI